MRRLATSKAVGWFAGLSIAYFLATLVVPLPKLINVLNGAFLGVGVLVTVIYAPLFWRSVRKSELDRVALLAIGIGSLWAAYVGSRAVSAYYRNFGGDVSKAFNNPWVGYFILIALAAGVLHVIAPGYPADGVKGKFGGRYRWYVIAALAVGIGAALALS
jgi:hypothetical protein